MDANRGSAISRREMVGLLAIGLAGCTPARILLNAYPEEFKQDQDLTERMLRSFADTVIPGAGAAGSVVPQAYADPFYPFAKYRAYFASDLCHRSHEVCGHEEFDRLSSGDRERVIAAGLAADGTTRKLYTGAILLTQVAFYGGIYDDRAGCAEIDFEGSYRFRGFEAITYPNPTEFLAASATTCGHPD